MMAFHKLFHIIHNRTDYIQLRRWIDEAMYPEYYAEKKQQAHNSVMRLALMMNHLHGLYEREY